MSPVTAAEGERAYTKALCSGGRGEGGGGGGGGEGGVREV